MRIGTPIAYVRVRIIFRKNGLLQMSQLLIAARFTIEQLSPLFFTVSTKAPSHAHHTSIHHTSMDTGVCYFRAKAASVQTMSLFADNGLDNKEYATKIMLSNKINVNIECNI